MPKFFVLLLMFFIGFEQASARVFSFKSESFAAYFRGTYGLTRLEQTPFEGGSGASTVYSGEKTEHTANFSGELGFLMNIHEDVTFRVGAEILQSKVSDIVGSNASGTKLFDLTSTIFVVNPVATLEWHFSNSDTVRFSVFGGAGIADVSMDLDYGFTATGLSDLGVAADYTEKSDALLISAHYGAQVEFSLADTVTTAVELGFRHMPIPEMKHKHDTNTILGASGKGTPVLDADGSNRTLDLSGFYMALAFRFYISFL